MDARTAYSALAAEGGGGGGGGGGGQEDLPIANPTANPTSLNAPPPLPASKRAVKRYSILKEDLHPVEKHFFVPQEYILVNEKYDQIRWKYDLNILQRVFLLCEEHSSSYLSELYCILVLTATVITILILIFSTIPEFKTFPRTCPELGPVCDNHPTLCPNKIICEPMPPSWFGEIENVCQFIFVIDYLTRNLLVGIVPTRLVNVLPAVYDIPHVEPIDGDLEVLTDSASIEEYFLNQKLKESVSHPDNHKYNYTFLKQQIKYSTSFMSIVDLLAIIPFFIELTNSRFVRLEVVRVIRLVRLLRLMKFGSIGESTKVLTKTMSSSFSALSILFLFALIGIVFFGSILFFFEGGRWVVNQEYPNGKYIRASKFGSESLKHFGGFDENSPFDSILDCMYWCFVSITTVGYGDYYTTTHFGRFIAVFCIYCGIFVFALPISVIGKNFSKELDAITGRGAEVTSKAIIELLSEFSDDPNFKLSAKTTAIIEDMKRRNYFQKDTGKYASRLLQLAEHKAKKLSAIVLISRTLCTTKHQIEILSKAKQLGLSDTMASEAERKEVDTESLSKTFKTLVSATNDSDNSLNIYTDYTASIEAIDMADRIRLQTMLLESRRKLKQLEEVLNNYTT